MRKILIAAILLVNLGWTLHLAVELAITKKMLVAAYTNIGVRDVQLVKTLAIMDKVAQGCKAEPPPYTDQELAEWFSTYNRRYFGDHLRKDTLVKWDFLVGKYGNTEEFEDGHFLIRIDVKHNREPEVARETILHEMAHVATIDKLGKDELPHGPTWKAEILRLMLEGAFDDLL